MLYIMPYKLGSESARDLAKGLNVLRISGKKRLRRYDTVINWGNKDMKPYSRWGNVKVINSPDAVAKASNKIETFIELTRAGVVTVPWTISKTHALKWHDEGEVVFARTYVNSSQGRGINVVTLDDDVFPNAALYTKFLSKCHEYRVHVAFGSVIDFSKKKRRTDVECNEYIRNHDNGWVFCREDVALPEKVSAESIKAISALGLDFGALDVLYKEKDNKAWVLEVNSAPGIQETTLTRYIEIFKRKFYV